MSDPIQSLLDAGVINTRLFGPESRYQGTPTAQYVDAAGRNVVYLRRRFIAQPGNFATMVEHTVAQGDRDDLLAAKYLGDPLLSWRLCDANVVFDARELTDRIGIRIRITLPAGVPAPARE